MVTNGAVEDFELEKTLFGIHDSNKRILATQEQQAEAVRDMVQELKGLRTDLVGAILKHTPEGMIPLKTHYLILIVALGVIKIEAIVPLLKNLFATL